MPCGYETPMLIPNKVVRHVTRLYSWDCTLCNIEFVVSITGAGLDWAWAEQWYLMDRAVHRGVIALHPLIAKPLPQ
jgi:hypothetical protein